MTTTMMNPGSSKLTSSSLQCRSNSFLSKYQVDVPRAIASIASLTPQSELPKQYQLGPNDVVCGRGKGSYNRPGNKRFRVLIQDHIQEYMKAKNKLDKTMVISSIIDRLRDQYNGRFVKQRKDGSWSEIGEDQVREKVGHSIREAIAAEEKTTTTMTMTTPNNLVLEAPQKSTGNHSTFSTELLKPERDAVVHRPSILSIVTLNGFQEDDLSSAEFMCDFQW